MAEGIILSRRLYNDQLLADITVEATTTNVDISGFTIDKNEEMRIIMTVKGVTSATNYRLFVNGNNTNTSYYRQEAYATSTTRSAARSNDCVVAYNSGGTRSCVEIRVKLTNEGYVIFQSVGERDILPTTPKLFLSFVTSTFTLTSITSIRLSSVTASSIGANTRIQIYKAGK